MLLKVLALITGISGILASRSEKFFRHDYIYINDYSAFYKVHSAHKSRTWDDAFVTCDDEGAKLFYPTDQFEWMVAGNLTNKLTDVDGIFVGVRDEFGLGDFVSVDGGIIPELSEQAMDIEGGDPKCGVMSVRTGLNSVGSCSYRRPFICKKLANEICPTVDSAYVYFKAEKSCYKVNMRKTIYSDALHTCLMEGGILATPIEDVIRKLRNFMEYEQSYFIGVRRIAPEGSFYDVQGARYEITEGRNDNRNCKALILRTDNEHMFEINSYNCNTTLPFICEMKAKF